MTIVNTTAQMVRTENSAGAAPASTSSWVTNNSLTTMPIVASTPPATINRRPMRSAPGWTAVRSSNSTLRIAHTSTNGRARAGS